MEFIATAYKAGRSSDGIAAEMGRPPSTIRYALGRMGIERRDSSACQRRYSCNHHFFSDVESERQSYWLGFISADGSIHRNVLKITLAGKDREHLERLRMDLEASHPITDSFVRGYPCSTLAIASPLIVAGLARYGVVERKTYTLAWPSLPEPFVAHFVRGYVDGDGGFYSGQRRHHARPGGPYHIDRYINFSVTSNRGFIESMQQHLMRRCMLNATKLAAHGDVVVTLQYGGGPQVRRIFEYLYAEATVWLPRKRDAVKDCFRQMALPL